jgi:hypothetical protein
MLALIIISKFRPFSKNSENPPTNISNISEFDAHKECHLLKVAKVQTKVTNIKKLRLLELVFYFLYDLLFYPSETSINKSLREF